MLLWRPVFAANSPCKSFVASSYERFAKVIEDKLDIKPAARSTPDTSSSHTEHRRRQKHRTMSPQVEKPPPGDFVSTFSSDPYDAEGMARPYKSDPYVRMKPETRE